MSTIHLETAATALSLHGIIRAFGESPISMLTNGNYRPRLGRMSPSGEIVLRDGTTAEADPDEDPPKPGDRLLVYTRGSRLG